MKITKYEHSCLEINEEQTRILIDPGEFTKSITNLNSVDAVVITHIHSDHFDRVFLQNIYKLNPNLKIFTVSQVANEITNLPVEVIQANDIRQIKNCTLEFFGGEHEFYNDFENIAVLVNNKLFHPGDSYTVPGKPIEILAAPASAPWLRVKEAGEYIANCKPKIVLPIHNILLSKEGKEIHYRILNAVCNDNKIAWQPLEAGESIIA